MIVIEKPYIESNGDKSRLYCDIIVDGKTEKVFVEVDKQYEKYLCTERCDAFLIALFYYAMVNNHDIFCEGYVSEDLLYQITEYLIPFLQVKSHNKLSNIFINCATAPNIENVGAVGSSVTCGVDSFYTIFNNINNPIESRKLTHLTIMNIADSYKKEGRYAYIMSYLYNKSEKIAQQLNLPLIKINSNMRDIFPIPPMHTLIRMFGVYSLQKLFGTYYFSSGYPAWTFNMEDTTLIDSARYDLLLCKELSTKNLFVYSEGSQKNRLEKLESISSYDIVKKNLHVCTKKEYNCGTCSKCVRTILELDSLGKLDEFRDVFDVDFYYTNQDYYFNEAVKMYNNGDIYVYDFIDKLKKKYNNEILKQINPENNICNRCFRLSDYKIYKNNKKNIIGISGGSGSGKSTIAQYIESKIEDCCVISVDDYMIKFLDEYKNQIIDKLHIQDNNRHWCNYIYNNYDDVKSWIDIIKRDINNCIAREIYLSNNKTIIIDSFMLPFLDVFDECILKIDVKSEKEIKLDRLKDRLDDTGRIVLFDDESLQKRVKYTDFIDYDSEYDYVIWNNNDSQITDTNCNLVLKKIKGKNILVS